MRNMLEIKGGPQQASITFNSARKAGMQEVLMAAHLGVSQIAPSKGPGTGNRSLDSYATTAALYLGGSRRDLRDLALSLSLSLSLVVCWVRECNIKGYFHGFRKIGFEEHIQEFQTFAESKRYFPGFDTPRS